MYYSSSYSNSGFYVFDPMENAKIFDDLKVDIIVTYSGDIFKCIHSFISRKYIIMSH